MKSHSSRSERRWFQAIGGGLLPLVPGLGAGILALHALFLGRHQRLTASHPRMDGLLGPDRDLGDLHPGTAAAGNDLAPGRSRARRGLVTLGSGAGDRSGHDDRSRDPLAGMLFAQLSSPRLWNTWATDDMVAQALTSLTQGSQLVSGVRDRAWHVPSGATTVNVSLDARLAQGTVPGGWNLEAASSRHA